MENVKHIGNFRPNVQFNSIFLFQFSSICMGFGKIAPVILVAVCNRSYFIAVFFRLRILRIVLSCLDIGNRIIQIGFVSVYGDRIGSSSFGIQIPYKERRIAVYIIQDHKVAIAAFQVSALCGEIEQIGRVIDTKVIGKSGNTVSGGIIKGK